MPSALIACCFRWKQGTLALQKVFPAVISGVAAAVLFSWIGLQINADALKKGFGVLLILTGLREVFYKKKTEGR